MRLLSPDPLPGGTPTAPEAPETPASPAPEAPAIVERTSTDRTPRERELETRLSEVENERDNLKRALYEPRTPKASPKARGALADVEAEFWGKG